MDIGALVSESSLSRSQARALRAALNPNIVPLVAKPTIPSSTCANIKEEELEDTRTPISDIRQSPKQESTLILDSSSDLTDLESDFEEAAQPVYTVVEKSSIASAWRLSCSERYRVLKEITYHEGVLSFRLRSLPIPASLLKCLVPYDAANFLRLQAYSWVNRPTPKIDCPVKGRTRTDPSSRPLVWASTRQELCESLPYFRSYQGGIYHHNGIALGYLLDGFGTTRDFVGDNVVISHGGGKSANNRISHESELISDQSRQDRGMAALINNYQQRIPLILIIGTNCSAAHFNIPHRYCVLDWFRISHIWTERESDNNCHVRCKVRFEKLTQEAGWWSVTRDNDKSEPGLKLSISSKRCPICLVTSPVIYQIDICLNSDCRRFWQLGKFHSTSLCLNLAAAEAIDPQEIAQPFNLRPPMQLSQDFFSASDTARVYWRGFCCPEAVCGKLNCRIHWQYWICSACGFKTSNLLTAHTAHELRDPFRPTYTGPPLIFNWTNTRSLVTIEMFEHGEFRLAKYNLGPDIGYILHLKVSDTKSSDVDNIFTNYQVQNIDFQRRPMHTKVDAKFLTGQFTHNAGAHYKFHVAIASESFDHCAPVISQALDHIRTRADLAMSMIDDSTFGSARFNELLSVAYLEQQKMDFHDDGEQGVGPVVASLSLGSSAWMKFRPKKAKVPELFKGYGADPGIHADMYDEQEPTDQHKNAYAGEIRSRDVLRLHLEHGDILVMAGPGIQRNLEHCVIPGGMRIAATARYIS